MCAFAIAAGPPCGCTLSAPLLHAAAPLPPRSTHCRACASRPPGAGRVAAERYCVARRHHARPCGLPPPPVPLPLDPSPRSHARSLPQVSRVVRTDVDAAELCGCWGPRLAFAPPPPCLPTSRGPAPLATSLLRPAADASVRRRRAGQPTSGSRVHPSAKGAQKGSACLLGGTHAPAGIVALAACSPPRRRVRYAPALYRLCGRARALAKCRHVAVTSRLPSGDHVRGFLWASAPSPHPAPPRQ